MTLCAVTKLYWFKSNIQNLATPLALRVTRSRTDTQLLLSDRFWTQGLLLLDVLKNHHFHDPFV